MNDLVLRYLILDVESADINFQNATGDDIDIAIYELMVAELKLNKYLKDFKLNGPLRKEVKIW